MASDSHARQLDCDISDRQARVTAEGETVDDRCRLKGQRELLESTVSVGLDACALGGEAVVVDGEYHREISADAFERESTIAVCDDGRWPIAKFSRLGRDPEVDAVERCRPCSADPHSGLESRLLKPDCRSHRKTYRG